MIFLCGHSFGAPPPTASESFLLIVDPGQDASKILAENFRRVFKFTSHSFREIVVQDCPALTKDQLKQFRAVIIAAEDAPRYLFGDDVLEYVKSGGTLFFAHRSWNKEWMLDLGIDRASSKEGSTFALGMGFETKEPVFRDVSLKIGMAKFAADFLKATFSPDWKVLITYLDPPGYPLLLARDFGKGKIVFWNGTCLHLKQMRGMMMFSLLRSQKIGAMSIFNANLFQIDDSPPPAYGVKAGPVYKDLGLTDFQFYTRVWYPKVLASLDERGYKPTHFCIFSYSAKVSGPFPLQTDRDEFFQEILDTIEKHRHEIAFHGYNHQSLSMTESPSELWPSSEKMVESLQAANQLWKKYRLQTTLAYVPPNNVIDKTGKEALIAGFPSLRGSCRLYVGTGEHSAGGDFSSELTGDEFGPDPDVPQLFEIPRLSAGTLLTDVQKLEITNGFMTHGLVNHFIHPDDMYDVDRQEDSWEKCLLNLQWLLRFVDNTFPYGQKMFTGDFLPVIKKYFVQPAEISWVAENKIKIHSPNLGRKFYYVFSDKPPILTGAKLVAEVEPGRLFLIELTQPTAEVEN